MHGWPEAKETSLPEDNELRSDCGRGSRSNAKATIRPRFEGLKLVDADILPVTGCVTRDDALNLGGDMRSILGIGNCGAEGNNFVFHCFYVFWLV